MSYFYTQYSNLKHYDYLCNNVFSYKSFSFRFQPLTLPVMKAKIFKYIYIFFIILLPCSKIFQRVSYYHGIKKKSNIFSLSGPLLSYFLTCPPKSPLLPLMNALFILPVTLWCFDHVLPTSPSWPLLLLCALPTLSLGSWPVPALEYA